MKNILIKNSIRRSQLIFYVCIAMLPVIQFCIFYLGVNINSIFLAFKKYDLYSNSYQWIGFDNFVNVFRDLGTLVYLKAALRNSCFIYLAGLLITTPLALIFSYYIYKKLPLHKTIKVILFIPVMLSSLIVILLFKYFVDRAVPALIEQIFGKQIPGLLTDTERALPTIIFFNIWSGFGSVILLYIGSMNSISDSLVEAAQIDGAGSLREFFYITLPHVFPTLSVYLITGIGGFFTNQMGLFSFFGTEAEYGLYTFGYFLYRAIKVAEPTDYPYLSAMGLLMTVVAVPITYLVKFLLEKFGPSTD